MAGFNKVLQPCISCNSELRSEPWTHSKWSNTSDLNPPPRHFACPPFVWPFLITFLHLESDPTPCYILPFVFPLQALLHITFIHTQLRRDAELQRGWLMWGRETRDPSFLFLIPPHWQLRLAPFSAKVIIILTRIHHQWPMVICYAPSHLPSSSRASDLACSLLWFSGLARFAPLSPALSFLLIRSYPCSWFHSPTRFMFPIFVLFHVPRPDPIPIPNPRSVLLRITSPCSIFIPMFFCPNPCLFPSTLLCSCKVFTTLLIGVSMVETLFTPVYGTVHWTRLSVYSCMDMLYRCYLLYSTHGPTLCKLPRYAPVRAHTTSVCCYNNITIN